jgi:hypothetical protein
MNESNCHPSYELVHPTDSGRDYFVPGQFETDGYSEQKWLLLHGFSSPNQVSVSANATQPGVCRLNRG